MINFLGQEIETGKCYVYLKTIRTGSSTQRKVKMIGICVKPTGRMQFARRWAEGYSFSIGTIDNLLNAEDVICEYTPTEEQWLKEAHQ